MKANELRIGNLFLGAGMIQTVNELHKYGDQPGYEYLILCKENGNQYKPIEIEGIPLTEEWLLKFGFEKETRINEEKYYKGKYLIENGISQFFDYGYSFRITTDNQNSTHAASIKYVHQLQNLYFALTGEELIKE